jgi:hypothetical protein
MLGIASSEEQPASGRTLVVYDEPVPLFTFPLKVGAVYSAETSFKDATISGIPNAGKETYVITVDAAGTLELPLFTLQNTLRLRIEADQQFVIQSVPGPIHSIQYLFVHECMGEVARIVSPAGTTDPHFTEAREFRRIGL